MAVITGLVDLGSGREDMYPTYPAPQHPKTLCSNRKFMNGVDALKDAQALSQSKPTRVVLIGEMPGIFPVTGFPLPPH